MKPKHSPSRFGVIDIDTGVTLPDFTISVSNRTAKRSAMSRGGFFMWDQSKGREMIRAIASSRELTGEALRVLFAMLEHVDYDNVILVSQVHLSEICAISRPAVSRSIKRLVDFGVLGVRQLPGGTPVYVLSPALAWKGDRTRREAALLAFESARGEALPA